MLLRTKSPHARLDFRANALKYRNLQKLKHTLNAKVDRLTTNMEGLAKNVETLASAMMDFKEIVASQSRSMEMIASLMQEQRDDVRDIRLSIIIR